MPDPILMLKSAIAAALVAVAIALLGRRLPRFASAVCAGRGPRLFPGLPAAGHEPALAAA